MELQTNPRHETDIIVFGNAPSVFIDRFEAITGYSPLIIPDIERLHQCFSHVRPSCICAFKPADGSFPTSLIQDIDTLKWLHVASAGIDHLTPWRRSDVVVTNSSGVHSQVLAEYVLCEILKHGLKSRVFDDQHARSEWKSHDLSSCLGKTACIIGFGSVGGTTGRLLAKVGMKVVAVTRSGTSRHADEGFHTVAITDLESVLPIADFIVVTLPLTVETKDLFSTDKFDRFKPGAYFINIGRGGIVDEEALCDALNSGQLSGATSDVFLSEPLPQGSPLWKQPKLRITPHSGDQEGWEGMVADLFAENLRIFRQKGELRNVVNPRRGY
jgi:phosphoglycerate dehydrogenase-like enzyme